MRKGLAFGFVLIGILAGCAAQQPGPVSTPTTSLQPQSVDWKAAKEVEVDLTEFHIDPAMLATIPSRAPTRFMKPSECLAKQ